jgi:hypothetical protein
MENCGRGNARGGDMGTQDYSAADTRTLRNSDQATAAGAMHECRSLTHFVADVSAIDSRTGFLRTMLFFEPADARGVEQ